MDLALEDIEAFLKEADPEPLQWEAKGAKLDAHAVRKAACAFANSNDGGYIILGAEEDKAAPLREDRWLLTGLMFPDEPKVWIATTIHDGLRPQPKVHVRSFPLGEQRYVALVWVPPVRDPPCVTRGTVYERLSGKSNPIKDPGRLAALYQRGERAHEIARDRAIRASDILMEGRLAAEGATTAALRFSIGLCTTAQAADVGAYLFTSSFLERLRDVVGDRVDEGPARRNVSVDVAQKSVMVRGIGSYRRDAWDLRAAWDGSIALAFETGQTWWPAEILVDHIERAWISALQLVADLGGHGDHYVAIRLTGQEFVAQVDEDGDGPGPTLLRRGPVAGLPSPAQREHLLRELKRASGYMALEPEPPISPSDAAGAPTVESP